MQAPSSRSVAALVALGLAASIGACGHSSKATRAADCARDITAAAGIVAQHIYAEDHTGPNATAYAHLLQRSARLTRAVAAGDATATQAAVAQLLRRQIIHIRITSATGAVLADMGRPGAIAPVSGSLTDPQGRTIGSFVLSVQDARAYVMVLHRLTGAEVLLRSGSRTLLGTLTPGPGDVPADASLGYGGHRYRALSFTGAAFPAAPLRISVLVPFEAARGQACTASSAATVADALGLAGQRIYEEEASSGDVTATIARLQHSRRFVGYVAQGDRAGVLRSIRGFFRLHRFHIVRVRVLRRSRVLADLGGPAVLGPARGVLRGAGGRVAGTVLVAVQDDLGYMKLAQRFLGAGVVMRTGGSGGRVVISTLNPVPATLPAHGPVRVAGRAYRTSSFSGRAFPSGELRITLLFPGS